MSRPHRLVLAAALFAWGSAALPAAAAPFGIVSLGTTGSAVVDHNAITGDDRGGIAVSTSRVFYSGDNATGRFALADLTGGASVGNHYDALAGDISTGDVYVFGGPNPVLGGQTATRLLMVNGSTGALTGGFITLSHSITLENGSGIFSGSGRIVVHTGTNAYSIAVPSGTVTDLGPVAPLNYYPCESYFYWGVAEEMNSAIYVAYRSDDSQYIVRTRLSTGSTTLVSAFTDIYDLCSFTVWPALNRWYFHHEVGSQFGGTFETLGFADAVFASTFADTDSDGEVDLADNCPDDSNADQLDTDGDLVGDVCDPCPTDPDVDGDEVCEEDNCPNHANPGQEDAENDGIGDACDTCSGPGTGDFDGDGACNGFDNCSLPNPDQADLDEDGLGDRCDNVDNTLALRGASMKVAPTGIGAVVKGSINQTEPFFDIPDATDGLEVEFYDDAFAYLNNSFDAGECTTSATKILCTKVDRSMTLQVKLKSAALGRVSFILKMKTEVGAPMYFLGPLFLHIGDYATWVDRSGVAAVCSTSPTKISCR